MAIVLSDTAWCDLWQESRERAEPADPQDTNDRLAICPQPFGTGYKRDIVLNNGIDLTFHRYQLHDDLIALSRPSDENDCLEWVFNLVSTFSFSDRLRVADGQHYVVGLFTPGGKSQDFACDLRVEVDIHLEPTVFQRLMGDRLQMLPVDLQRILEGDEEMPFSSVRPITPAMRLVLQQMLDCPYQGTIKQLYLESKSIEVLTLWLDQAMASDSPQPPTRLRVSDIDRIHQAKEILFQQLADPPSLMTLARQVGLNDCTLKRGFQQVFGTTVFGYVRDRRMEQACRLLLQGDIKVGEVSQVVGYTNRSRFAAAFRKKFGLNPKDYQIKHRRLG
jgi:AraC family transcriptional regulator, transcriptional activator of the genes for pyochelin and ferripyochelin receptors